MTTKLPVIAIPSWVCLVAALAGCGEPGTENRAEVGPPPVGPANGVPEVQVEAVHTWVRTTYAEIAATKFWAPPPAARAYSLLTVALYAGYGQGLPGVPLLEDVLPGFPVVHPAAFVDRGVVGARVAQRVLSRVLVQSQYPGPLPELLERIADLMTDDRRELGVPEDVVVRSIAHGDDVADRLLDWAAEDGFATERSAPFHAPEFPGAWERTGVKRDNPVEPHWGKLRPYAADVFAQCPVAPHVPYSTEPDSPFHAQAREVYARATSRTRDEEALGRFWADEPGESGLPPGHWINIATLIARQERLDLANTLELYLRVGLVLADSFIVCWRAKYDTFLLRPVTYIRAHIDPNFQTLVVTPPFPSYTSGHSTVSGAAATVIEAQLGAVSFTDSTSQGRFPPRRFESPWHAAEEASLSRIVTGIHFPMDCIEGLRNGACIGAVHATRFANARRPTP